jgi:carbon storage regulator
MEGVAMLVLSRKLGESIVIDDEIVLKVTEVQGKRVKLSLQAPRERRILRAEIAALERETARNLELHSRRETPSSPLTNAN